MVEFTHGKLTMVITNGGRHIHPGIWGPVEQVAWVAKVASDTSEISERFREVLGVLGVMSCGFLDVDGIS